MPRVALRVLIAVLLVGLIVPTTALAQPVGPQPWWPTQPQRLPLVHPLFADDAVLQRDVAAPIWGWTTPGDKITVTLDGEKSDGRQVAPVATAGPDGKWTTRLAPQQAGGPHTLTIESSGPADDGRAQKVVLKNILFGDVWLCTGQSNMNWQLRLSNNGEEEVKQANYPEIRSFTVSFYSSLVPMKLPPPAKWEVCTPEFARSFTAVGYFFAREIHSKVKVPIGIIHSSAGATAAEAWVSGDALRREMPYDFPPRLEELDKLIAPGGVDFDYFRACEQWTAKVDPLSAERKFISDPQLNTDDWLDVNVPKAWEESGVAPLKDFDGLVWFRREIEIPEAWAGQDLSLWLSVINDYDIAWLNGELIGARQLAGGRIYHVDKRLVRPGKNVLVVAVLNLKGPGGLLF